MRVRWERTRRRGRGAGGKDYRNKPPSEETPFPKNGIAEQTPFHILHTRNKPPSIAEETLFPKNAIAEQPPSSF
ncbi:hypothetical protein DPMN_092043 [Dreissena polymorpha]|uniref:Uncharacterized protein n=1 Tax=Dreissena polymorpha TaxID=45954 RepID=A0A9D4L187_DREPO|nr:hypothetical protein DPMN_092043 [Dreissena polymorpha]